jgi:hypothetical protein
VDGQVSGGGVRGQDNGDVIVYDNEMDTSDTATPATSISGGSIVIHSR